MKLLQISDLHIGKRLHEFSLIEDQRYVLDEAIQVMEEKGVSAVLLCGDIYDVPVPSAEATNVLDTFLSKLHKKGIEVFMITGNHDSSDRLHYVSTVLTSIGIHVVTKAADCVTPFAFQGVNIYLMPFLRPADVNDAFGLDTHTYQDAIAAVVERMNVDPSKTNILVAHQMVLPNDGSELHLDGSEDIVTNSDGIVVGDVASVNASVFAPFDYVALGHIHKPMNVASNARYAGSIFKYHRDESQTEKSFTLLDVDGKTIHREIIPIRFLHDVVQLTGTLETILKIEENHNDYVFANLEDEELLEDPMARLRMVFPYVAGIRYTKRTEGIRTFDKVEVDKINMEDLFAKFFEEQNGKPMTEYQKEMITQYLQTKEEE